MRNAFIRPAWLAQRVLHLGTKLALLENEMQIEVGVNLRPRRVKPNFLLERQALDERPLEDVVAKAPHALDVEAIHLWMRS